MNGKYFTLLTFFVAMSLNLGAQKVISNVVRNAEKCAVTSAYSGISNNQSYLVNTKVAKKTNANRAIKKYALAEEFTNASCPPCAAQNPAYNAILLNNTDKVIAVKYQVWFPGYDPMYETNTAEVQARWETYATYTTSLYGNDNGLGGVPTAFVDGYMGHGNYGGGVWAGSWYYGAPGGYNAAVFEYAAAQQSQLDIEVNHSYNQSIDSILITVDVSNNSDSTFTNTGYKLHTLVLEAELAWAIAPGTNGEKKFEHVFRKAASNVNGDNVIPATLEAGNTASYTYAVPISSYIFKLNQIEAVAFLQKTSDLSIMNASLSEPTAYPAGSVVGDPAVANASSASDKLCPDAYTAQPAIRITNNNASQEDITQVTAYYELNGVEFTKSFTETIAYNQSKVLNFDEVTVDGGSNIISTGLISFNNGGIDENRINNSSVPFSFSYLSEDGEPAPVTKDFEETLNIPENLYLSQVDFSKIFLVNRASFGQNGKNSAGAYATSENSLMFWFYDWAPSESLPATISITHNKVNMPNNPIYSFDWAYTGYTGNGSTYDNDKLEFYYSTDCGENWTLFKSKQQATFKTAPNQGPMFIPTATQWKSDTTRLDALANLEDVVFQIRATSDYGNNAYLDNLFIGQDPAVSAVSKIKSFENVSVFPNPTSDNLNIKINAFSPSNVSIKLLDYTGRAVQSLNNNQAVQGGVNNLSFNVGNFPSGMYLIRIENKEGVNIHPVSIIK